MFLGSQPISASGDWVFDYEKLEEQYPEEYLFIEASARENMQILGERYFRDLKRVLPKVVYDLEVENLRRKQNINGFYPLLSDKKHTYIDSFNYSYLDNDADQKSISTDCRSDRDCIQDEPLYISFDFGSTQNCMIVSQWHKSINRMPIIKNFYVENETLTVLVQQFIDYYQHKRGRTVYVYGGSDGTRRNDASSRQSYFDDVIDQLTKAGWHAHLRAELYEAGHMDKFQFWHKFLSGDYTNIPSFAINMNNAMETFVSMDNAPIKPDEFKKDKTSERRKDQPRWKATDLSDAADNLYYWMFSPALDASGPTHDMIILGK
jgi:hypothetical protein